MSKPRLHPESWRQLRQLVKLHGVVPLKDALDSIAEEHLKPLPPGELERIIKGDDDVR